MLYFYVSVAYTIVNIGLAMVLIFRSRQHVVRKFYAFCVFALSCVGISGYILGHPFPGVHAEIAEKMNAFLYSVFPFFFLHFLLVFVRQYKILSSRSVIIAIYATGLFSYVMVLLGFIPIPFSSLGGIASAGYIYYITWSSLLFTIGIALNYSLVRRTSDGGHSNLLFVCLALLMLLLPTPLTLSIFSAISVESYGWYSIASILALAIAVSVVLRHKAEHGTPNDAINAALALMNNFVIRTDRNLRIQSAEGALCSLLGYSEKELTALSLTSLVREKDYLENYRYFAITGKMRETAFDALVICRNGMRVPMLLSLAPVLTDEQITGFVAVGRESNSAERTQEDIEKDEVLFHSLFEGNPKPAWIYETDTVSFLAVNDAAINHYGYSQAEFLSMVVTDVTADGEVPLSLPSHGWRNGIKHRKKDGSVIDIDVESHELQFQGKSTRLEIIHDVTEWKKAQRTREQQLSTYEFARTIIDSSSDMIIAVDADRKITEFNKAAQQTFGYEPEEVLGRSVDILYADPDSGIPVNKSVIAQGNVTRMVMNKRKNNEVFPSLLSASVVNDSDGNLIGVMGVSHDATSRLEVERMKNEFVSTVSDELRTPLTSIVASLNLIAESPAGSVSKDLLPLVTIANENSERLMKLVNDILDMEKLEFHKMEFHIENTDVLPLVERAIETMEPWARKLGVEIEMKVAGGSSRVDADPERLHQVLTNLLSNAIKFSPQSGHVQVSLSTAEERVRIEVTDHGPGIPEEFQSRIFERFARADGPSGRKRGGTGLGLRISKEIMERLGGTIGFHSEPGIRTTFHIELPELA